MYNVKKNNNYLTMSLQLRCFNATVLLVRHQILLSLKYNYRSVTLFIEFVRRNTGM